MAAMDLTFTCPKCGEVTLVGEEFVGQSGECRACGAVVTVPAVSTSGRFADLPATAASASGGWWKSILRVGLLVFLGLVLLAFLLPSFRYAGPAARRMQSANNLKQIALAMHNYHDTYNKFPKAYHLTPDGKRTLSWRVAIMPFIEHSDVFDRYRADEAWDSESNQALAELRIHSYRNPGEKTGDATDTSYMVITGPGTLFEEGKDITLADCTDGTANTILAVEVVHSGVNWTQPVDLDIRNIIFKINSGGFGISSPWKGGANVALADGSVRFLSEKVLESTLKAMMTRAGGETISDIEGY